MSKKPVSKKYGRLRFSDFFVVILFLFTAALSINMFRTDLMQTIKLKNKEPLGEVVIRKNIVQRRLSDRVLWDRLSALSPVYDGDLIRVAQLSEATLYMDGNSIDLGENTLVRIRREAESEGLRILMSEGSVSVAANIGSRKVLIEAKGKKIETKEGSSVSIFNVETEFDTMILRVNEGTVQLIDDDRIIDISGGENITLNADGEVRHVKSAAVINPVNAEINLQSPAANTVITIEKRSAAFRAPSRTAAVTAPKKQEAQQERLTEPALEPVSALGTPQNLQPAKGRRYTTSDLQTQRSIDFSWQLVSGANAYIVTIYRQSAGRRRQIFSSPPINRASFSFENLSLLDNGTFIWQVEAQHISSGGEIEQRSSAAESTFIMDIAMPGRVRTEGIEDIEDTDE